MKRVAGSLAVAMGLAYLLIGCGGEGTFRRAKKAEKKGNYYRAWELYQDFAANNPKHASAPEAIFRAGWLAEQRLADCHAASTFYQDVMARYPQAEPWARLASHQQDNCPDYFPLVGGMTWIEGDSESGGQNARIETSCEAEMPGDDGFPSPNGWLVRTFYGGDAKFKTTRHLYKKQQGEVQEFQGEEAPVPRVVLKWPLQPGTKWNTRVGDRVAQFEIVDDKQKVRVKAGEFEGCLQVRWTLPGIPGATNEYYAPGVGRVLTSYATEAGEKRKTELISYQPGKTSMPGAKDEDH